MSQAYSCSVVERDGNRAVIEVRQTHPDYAFGAHFPERWGGVAAAGWAFPETGLFVWSSEGRREAVPVPRGAALLVEELGGFDDLFAGFDRLGEALRVSSFEVIRGGYNDDNREDRMRDAGFTEEEIEDADLTPDVVARICGLGRITLVARDAGHLDGLEVGMCWEF